MTQRHWALIGWAFIWLLVLCAVWIDWRWPLTIFALICLLGLIKKAGELPRSPPNPR